MEKISEAAIEIAVLGAAVGLGVSLLPKGKTGDLGKAVLELWLFAQAVFLLRDIF